MEAIEALKDPYQRAALLLLRWSGARRGEITRLTLDCLDAYPDGYPRLRIPVGKTYTERAIPLHPQAADALRELIDQAHSADAAARHDHASGRSRVRWVFVRRGQPLGKRYLFEDGLATACTGPACRRHAGPPSPRTGSATPSAPSSPRAAPASRRSWRSSGTAARGCR